MYLTVKAEFATFPYKFSATVFDNAESQLNTNAGFCALDNVVKIVQ
jgi:hypothetical protein